MPVSDPKRLNERYNAFFAARDLDGLMALHEEDAVLCPAPGQEIRGRAEISKRLARLLAMKGVLEASEQSCVAFENCALLHARWRFVGTTGEGKPIEFGGASSKLARRGPDGNWRYVIDMPTGGV